MLVLEWDVDVVGCYLSALLVSLNKSVRLMWGKGAPFHVTFASCAGPLHCAAGVVVGVDKTDWHSPVRITAKVSPSCMMMIQLGSVAKLKILVCCLVVDAVAGLAAGAHILSSSSSEVGLPHFL